MWGLIEYPSCGPLTKVDEVVKLSRSDDTRNQTPSGYWTIEGVESHRSTNPGAPALAINGTKEFGKQCVGKTEKKNGKKKGPSCNPYLPLGLGRELPQ